MEICFITSEIALHQEAPNYSGGLGVMSGDLSRAAYAAGVPFPVFTILYSEGYYDQQVVDGKMTVNYKTWDYEKILSDTGVEFHIRIHTNRLVCVKIWELPAGKYGSSKVYFLS